MMNPGATRAAVAATVVKWAVGTAAILIFWATGFGAGRSFEQSRLKADIVAVATLTPPGPNGPSGPKSPSEPKAPSTDDNPPVDFCYIDTDYAVSPTDPLGPEVEKGWALWGHRAGARWHMRRYLGGNDATRREDVVAEAARLGCPLKENPHE